MTILERIKHRSEILRRIRVFFYDRNFLEVQTPTLLPDTMVDQYIDPISVRVSGRGEDIFLQTSPEFAMKQLLLEGCTAIFEITPAYRDAEFGSHHNAEFTMLEWYRVGDNYAAGIQFLEDFSTTFFPKRKVEKVSYLEAFEAHFNLNPHTATAPELKSLSEKISIDIPVSLNPDDRDSWLQLLMDSRVDRTLGGGGATILYDWPSSQSALAKVRNVYDDNETKYQVAERFELYIDGVELANGYHELCDGDEQLRRLESNNKQRLASGKPSLPTRSKLTSSMQHQPLPDCAGVALGVDRLLMLLLGTGSIADI
ncbi:EF-P lysine aminoacylase EpmA [Pirellulaceae bacterium]|jgi:lysyl-tRNA synthetase class 2|nr:EF-P lysine aminoacylase EpmA [Pirellulaceae bacterium]MDB4641003.1 EF-P lysine aminoacylase EpmA [Pirellulaceae bacterium]